MIKSLRISFEKFFKNVFYLSAAVTTVLLLVDIFSAKPNLISYGNDISIPFLDVIRKSIKVFVVE